MLTPFSCSTRRLLHLGSLLAGLLGAGCQRQPAATAATGCIDPAQVNPSGICTMEYDPVCGCDGKTYANPCAARNAGVRSFQRGACASAR